MKTKTLVSVGLLAFLLASSVLADVIVEETVVLGTPLTLAEHNAMLADKGEQARSALPWVPARKDEGTLIFSVCPSSSSYITQTRANMMGWMAGADSIPTNRTANPAACYSIPSDGLQWFDFLVTDYKSYLGVMNPQNPATTNENGHRIVVSAACKAPVSNYWCRITSTSTNIGGAYFPIGLFSGTTNEIPFNLNFVGIYFGTNGILESFYDTTLSHWVQAGDDVVYVNGEFPSQVPYDWAYRLGATIQKNIALPGDVKVVKDEFVAGVQSLTTELVNVSIGTNGIGTVTVTAAQPSISIWNVPGAVRFMITGGQVGFPHRYFTSTNITTPLNQWTLFYTNQLFYPGVVYEDPAPDQQRYFRAQAISP